MKSGYRKSDDEAVETLKNIPIIHLHGKLGELKELHKGGRPYDHIPKPEVVKIAMEGISVIHEKLIFSIGLLLPVSISIAVFWLSFSMTRSTVFPLLTGTSCLTLKPLSL